MFNRRLVHPIRFAFILFLVSSIICVGIAFGDRDLSKKMFNSFPFTKVEAAEVEQVHSCIEEPEAIDESNITEEEWMEAFYIDCVKHDVDPREAFDRLSLGEIKNEYLRSDVREQGQD